MVQQDHLIDKHVAEHVNFFKDIPRQQQKNVFSSSSPSSLLIYMALCLNNNVAIYYIYV